MMSEPVEPYFTRSLRVLTFCLGVSKIVIDMKMKIRDSEKQGNLIKLNKVFWQKDEVIHYNLQMVKEAGLKVYNERTVQLCGWGNNGKFAYDSDGFIKKLRIFTLYFLIMTGQ